ncbi:MAG: helix-turn-helix domain-containing protein, partial [Gammaproteobacteria bacterium]|nr:helix-turn-helix domain-containing protein [Gammaproteobacteria bacterium]
MENINTFTIKKRSRDQLESWLKSTTLPQGQVTRAKIILSLADGYGAQTIVSMQRVSRKTVYKRKNRYLEQG